MNSIVTGRPGRTGLQLSAAPSQRGTILRYKADRLPVAYVLALFAVRACIWALATPLFCAIAMLPLVGLSIMIGAINHHHQHVNTFRAGWLNRLYELVLALQTGVAPYSWVLHHNLGHHRNYLNQRPHAQPDESRWTRADGSQMARFEYSLDLLLRHQLDIVRIGRQHPRYLRAWLLMKLPLWGLIGVMLWLRPIETLLVFLVPAFLTLYHTIWVTYEHHAGTPTTSHLDASRNRVHPAYNFLTANLGFHTAHHKRPGLHWSLLPALHAEIEGDIPEDQISERFW